MKFYEQQIELYTNKIKRLEESTDQTRLRSSKLHYELKREMAQWRLDAIKEGKPLIEGHSANMALYQSMGFTTISFPNTVDDTSDYAEYKIMLERMGFPEKCCERAHAQLAMCEVGDLPVPHVIFNSGHGCDADRLVRTGIARWFKVPVFYVDANLKRGTLANLNYIANQLGEFTEWAEKKIPGIKYREDKLREIHETNAIGVGYLQEIYRLIKHVPCPITPDEALRDRLREPYRFSNIKKANEYLRVLRDELGERVASGKGPYPEERLRLLWAGEEPTCLEPGRLMLERKVALPQQITGHPVLRWVLRYVPHGEVSEYGVVLSPLQDEARHIDVVFWGGLSEIWLDITLDTARDIGAHGIILSLIMGCTPVLGLGSMLAERAEKELGIPVFNVEGRLLDKEYRSQEQWDEILSPFIDKCFDRAGKPRQ